ncbi:immunity protein YezG family protein [Nocardiopsis sp. NPDC058631]|uniref:immunity protein YezG family protein n=1 Tax=Nocardiopsis sp. NPDC058631 TaxID=3346566 RepID=UPI0036529C61
MSHLFRKGHLDVAAQKEILTQIGMRIFEGAPDGWTRLIYRIETVVEHGTSELVVEFEDGSSRRTATPAGITMMIDELRAGMYQEGKGTWFSMEYVITRPGKFAVNYNYDDDPGITFPTAFGFTNDLKCFPRDEENIPDWLREKLVEEAEGRATE